MLLSVLITETQPHPKDIAPHFLSLFQNSQMAVSEAAPYCTQIPQLWALWN